MNDIVVRDQWRDGDVQAITRLHAQYYARNNGFDPTFESYVAIPLAEFAARAQDNEQLWVVDEGGEVRGCIAVVDGGAGTAQLRWYLLDEAVQGRGLGRRLIESAIEFSRRKGYQGILLWTVGEQQRAIGLYQQNGFELVEEKPCRLWGKDVVAQCFRLALSADD